MRAAKLALTFILANTLLAAARPATAATYVVSSAADTDDGVCGDGHCTLREAIRAANANPGRDQIVFLIRPLDQTVKTIHLASPLPLVSDAAGVDITGLTQPGSSASTKTNGTSDAKLLVELDGSGAGSPANGFVVAGGATTIDGLVINRFAGSGIQLAGGEGHEVSDNFIGTDPTGLVALGNADDGVDVLVPGCRVLRNLISGNHRDGIELAGESSHSVVEGNLFGLSAAGLPEVGNWRAGIAVFTSRNQIGGLTAASGNHVAGNLDVGVVCVTSDSHDNVIQSNTIFANRSHGVMITVDAARNRIGRAGSEFLQPSNTVSNNGGNGICVTASAGTPNPVLPFRAEGNELIAIDFTGGVEDEFGVTPNDPLDADTGPNDLQNWPELDGAVTDGARSWVYGKVLGRPGTDLIVSFYSESTCHPSGHGDGRLVGGGLVAHTDDAGEAWAQAEIEAVEGEMVSAVASDVDGNSSEFSNCVPVVLGPTPTARPTATATTPATETATETPLPPSPTPTATAETATPTTTASATDTTPPTTTPTTVSAMAGDANCDARIGVADVCAVMQQIGLAALQCGADVDGNEVVDAADLGALVGLIFRDRTQPAR